MASKRNSDNDELKPELEVVGKKPSGVAVCRAYDSFKSALHDVRKCYQVLNPTSGRLSDEELGLKEEVLEEFRRGAVISVLSIWEFYVQDLLSEAFNHVVHIDDETSTPEDSSDDSQDSGKWQGSYRELRKVKKTWPNSQVVIQEAIKRRSDPAQPVLCNYTVYFGRTLCFFPDMDD